MCVCGVGGQKHLILENDPSPIKMLISKSPDVIGGKVGIKMIPVGGSSRPREFRFYSRSGGWSRMQFEEFDVDKIP